MTPKFFNKECSTSPFTSLRDRTSLITIHGTCPTRDVPGNIQLCILKGSGSLRSYSCPLQGISRHLRPVRHHTTLFTTKHHPRRRPRLGLTVSHSSSKGWHSSSCHSMFHSNASVHSDLRSHLLCFETRNMNAPMWRPAALIKADQSMRSAIIKASGQ